MKQFLTKMWVWMGKANCENNGNPSSRRAQVTFVVSLFTISLTFAYIWILIYYKSYIMEATVILSSDLLLLLGISTTGKAIEVNGEVRQAEINKSINADKMTPEQTKDVKIAEAEK